MPRRKKDGSKYVKPKKRRFTGNQHGKNKKIVVRRKTSDKSPISCSSSSSTEAGSFKTPVNKILVDPATNDHLVSGCTSSFSCSESSATMPTSILVDPVTNDHLVSGCTSSFSCSESSATMPTSILVDPVTNDHLVSGCTSSFPRSEISPASPTRILVDPVTNDHLVSGCTSSFSCSESSATMPTSILVDPVTNDHLVSGCTSSFPRSEISPASPTRSFHPVVASTPVAPPTPEMKGRRIVNFGHLWTQLQAANVHPGPFSCNINSMQVVDETRHGMVSSFTLKCSMCCYTTIISTDVTEKLNVNKAAVAGALAIGVGHSQLEELLGAIDLPCMSGTFYRAIEADIGENLSKAATQLMEEAAKKEAELAIAAGDVDDEGNPLISVIADGSWAKRSYKTKYNSLSGVAAIIGARTKQVLFLGVKNKYCVVCSRAEAKGEEPKQHKCFRNWSGTSTAMEAAIILEGFEQSMSMYGLKYHKIVGDGDSSVNEKLQSRRPYGTLGITKVECSNHLLRCYARNLKKLSENRLAGPPRIRKLLGQNVVRMRGAVKAASIYWSQQDGPLQQRIDALREDVNNSAHHIFGDHAKCRPYFCQGPKEDEENVVPELRATALWSQILEVISNIGRHSPSLIQRLTSNIVEGFNSVIAKLIGGKRINFCQRGSYQARCMGAVVAHNSQSMLSCLQRQMTKRSPAFYTKKTEAIRRRRLMRRLGRPLIKRRLFQTSMSKCPDQDYGPQASKPDLEGHEMARETDLFLQKLNLSNDELRELERSTLHQSNSSLWFEERRKRLTASNFGKIVKMRPTTSCKALVKSLVYPRNFDSKATSYGRYHEKEAIRLLEEQRGIEVLQSGLVIHPMYPFLAASPDGVVGEDTTVEVKCPYSLRDLTPEEAVKSGKVGVLRWNSVSDCVEVNKRHDFYYQVQGQLEVTGRQKCFFVVYTKHHPFILSTVIERDRGFCQKMLEPLEKFFMNCVLPELVDPRATRSMPIREPSYIVQAQATVFHLFCTHLRTLIILLPSVEFYCWTEN